MRIRSRNLILAASLLALAACNGGGGGAPSGNALVTGQISATSESSEPISINEKTLQFSENEHAFDALLQ